MSLHSIAKQNKLKSGFNSWNLSIAGKIHQNPTISIPSSSASCLIEAWLFSTRNCLCVMFSTECKLPTQGYERTRAPRQLTTFIHAFATKNCKVPTNSHQKARQMAFEEEPQWQVMCLLWRREATKKTGVQWKQNQIPNLSPLTSRFSFRLFSPSSCRAWQNS